MQQHEVVIEEIAVRMGHEECPDLLSMVNLKAGREKRGHEGDNDVSLNGTVHDRQIREKLGLSATA
jgi:hypothetical protein